MAKKKKKKQRQTSTYSAPVSEYRKDIFSKKKNNTSKKKSTSAKETAKKQTITSKNSRLQDVAPIRQRESSAYKTVSESRKTTPTKSNSSAKKTAQKQTSTSRNSRVQDVAPIRQRETSTYTTPRSEYNQREKVSNSTSALSRSKNSRVQDVAPVKKKDDNRTWFQKSEAFKDGYQFGDVTKTILGSATDVVENLTSGVMGMGEAIVDASAYLAPGAYLSSPANYHTVPDMKLYNEMQTEMDKFIKKDLYNEQAIARKIISDPIKKTGFDPLSQSVFGEKSDALVQSAGQLGATAGLQALGVPWFVTTGVTSFGGEVENAMKQGASYGEAGGSALISAGAEILSEKLSGGISFGGKTMDDVLVKNLTTRISDKTIRSLTKAGIDAVGEGSEEVVSSVFSRLGSALYKEESIDELLTSEEAMDEYIESFIGGAVLGGGSSVINATKSNAQGKDFATGLSNNELKVAQAEINNRIAEREADGTKLSTKEKNAITQQVYKDLEKGYISIDTIESTLGGETYKSYKSMTEQRESLEKELKELENAPNTVGNSRQYDEVQSKLSELKNNQSREQLDNEMYSLIANDKLLQESYNERSRRGQTFEADLSKYDVKQQEVIKRATESGILNNTNRTHEFVDMVAKISADKGVLFDFTNNEKLKESGFAMDGKTINGYVKDGNIAVNINSNKALNTIVGHEITHVLEGTELYTELQNAVKEYATTKGEYQARYDAFVKLYKDVDSAVIDNEVTADLVGDYLFTDADFVSRLSAEKPNVFKKIYDEIKYFVKTITSGKEARELEKVKRAFDKAYKESSKAGKDTKYSVSDKNIKDVMNDYASGESYYTMSYTQDGKVVATLEYSEYDGEPNVKMIEVEPEYRRKGIGTKLLQELQRKYPDTEISFGMTTPDGTKLLESATYTVENKDVTDKLARIKEIQKVLDKYDEGLNNFFENDIEVPDNYAEDYNELYDEKVALQQELRGKKKSKTFVKTDTKYSLSEDSKGNKLSPAVQKRFENSKAVDEDGNLKVLYHGTPGGEFYIFDKSKGSVEGDFGSGFYFTDNESDVESNYEGGGPDFENKVARRAEQIENDEEIDYDEAEEKARAELFKGSGKFEVYLNIENPAIVGKTMLFEQDKYLEEYDENDYDDYDEYIGEVEQLVADDIDNIVWEVERNVDVDDASGISDILYNAYYEGGIDIADLKERVNELYLEDSEGNIVGNEVTRQIIESLGYDGIIDNTVSKKFRNMGLDADTTHYIVFKPNQIKNITNQNPTDNPDVRYSLSEDSDGKKLSKEQQDYFKDSKVRDENGNLKVMYHGTANDFTVFNPMLQGGKNGIQEGYGIYFTDTKDITDSYGDKKLTGYLNVKRPANSNRKTIKQSELAKLIKATCEKEAQQFIDDGDYDDINDALRDTWISNYVDTYDMTIKEAYNEVAKEILRMESNDMNIVQEVMGGNGIRDYKSAYEFYDILKDVTGIDGFVTEWEQSTGEKNQIVVVFDSNQFKNSTNQNPTLDPDIRYSLSEDSNGKKLSNAQKEYFKDSKVRDENGNLKVMYHGTSSGGHTVFAPFEKSRFGLFGAGTYFTDNKSVAESYTEKGKGNDKQVYETYLNIKNPMDMDAPADPKAWKHYFADADYPTEGTNEQFFKAMVEVFHEEQYPTWEAKDTAMDVIESMGYDGITHIGGGRFNKSDETRHRVYIAFESNQIKNVNNLNPTSDADIRYSLSDDDYAPFQGEYAPLTEAEANERDAMQNGRLQSLNERDMPSEIDAPYYGENPIGEVKPFDERDIEDVGKRSVKAYMYENPEVKPFFQEEAEIMLRELRDSTKGERSFNDQLYYDTGGEQGWFATKRQTSDEIAYLLDNFPYTYADIERGLKAIIEDHGAENNAVSKRIEFMIDERLREGYTDFTSGMDIPNNPDYIALLEHKQITEYNDEAYNRWVESLAQDHFADVNNMVDDIAPVKTSDEKQAKPKQATKDVAPVKDTGKAEAPKVKGTTEQQEIAKILSEEPKNDSQRNKRKWAIFKANVFDKGAVFEDLSLKKKNRELMGKWNYTLYSEARAQRLMGSGEAKHNVKSLNSIREKVESSGLSKEFQEYMYHKHNIDRMRLKDRFDGMENKPVFGDSVTAEMSQEIVNQYEFAVPEFQEYAQEVYNYNKYLRQQLVDTGVISKETAKLWEQMYPHYVPIRRVGDKGLNVNVPLDTGRTGVNAPIKKATGGSSDILPMFDTMAMRTMQTFKATAKNSFGVELKNTLGVETVKASTTVDEMIDSIDAQDSLLQEGVNGSKPTFTVFENGERVTFEITEDMYDALKPVSDSSLLSKTIKPLNIASNIHRGLLTEYNPVFMLNNAIKDVQDLLMNSQHATKTYLKIPEAHKQMITKGYWYNEYMENGGEQNSYFDNESNSFDTGRKGVSKALDFFPLKAISKANNYIEMIPRLAEYIASREAGRSVEVSMLDSARVTTNFRAGGDLTKFINRNGGTFLNASVQGAMQQVRNVREANMNGLKGWANLATKFAIAGVPTFLLNNMLWDDDDDYEELSDYVKQSYYVIGKYGDGQFIRIPKGRTVAVIQEGLRQIGNATTGNDEADLKSYLEFVVSNLAPNNPLENNVLAPIMQVVNNETWYGEDLVPSRLQDVPKAEQFDESTDSFSRFLGEKLDISPIKINYLLDQYTGGVGDVVLPMLTPEAESGDDSLVGNLLAPLKKKFTTDSVMNNQNVSDFYALSDELTLKANMSNATEEDILRNKYINSIKSDLGELYAEKREIQNTGWMSDEFKYKEVRKIQQKIDELTEEALNSYESMDVSGRYATVGDKHFLLNEESGWRTLNEEQVEKQEKASELLGITAKEYWDNDDDKYAYDWAVKNPEYYQVSRAISTDLLTYWKHNDYMWNNIRADKDENGKSISGSKKAKIIDYINNIDDLEYEEKLVLFKKYYPADDTYNYEIIDYLNSRDDISYDEMETILKELDFEVDEDGNISW